MKKEMKRIISLVLTFALLISGITYSGAVSVKADGNEWKTNAVTVPAEGQLVPAGYIDVSFDNSMEGYTYTVYLDGQPMYWNGDDIVKTGIGEKTDDKSVIKTFTSQDTGKTEVYTTTVSKHELTVKAVKGSEEITSEARTFYVSKKGLALGGDMSDKVSLRKLNCSWYYNWSTDAFNNSVDAGVQHIPMMWGGGDDNKESMTSLTTTANYILGFNEPDIDGQANMEFCEGIDVWNEYISPLKLRKVSPAPAAPGGDSKWLERFMKGDYKCKKPDGTWGVYNDYLDDTTKTWVDGKEGDVDAVVLHYYRNVIDLNGLLEAVKTLWNKYHKPIWITEMSVFGMKGMGRYDHSYNIPSERKKMADFVSGIIENMDEVPYVERYCWFPYDIESKNDIDAYDGCGATAMFDYTSGNYTELGRLYSNSGNPTGYSAETISDDEMFIYKEQETTTKPQTTTAANTPEQTTVSQTESSTRLTVSDTFGVPGKVKLKTARNVKKQKVKLTWKKVAGVTKYQVQYALNKKFTKGLKAKVAKKVKFTVKGLKKNKKYYFRVRAVNRTVKGKWSNVKSIKIKK